jgi:polyisoprenoid-binding protein YceI
VGAAALMVVAGCGARPSAPAQVVTVARPAGTTPFQLDAQASQIWLFLHADGPMSKIGHAHVITTHGLQGSIWLHPQTEHSGCEFVLPVAALVVDDPQEREAAGGEFAEPLDEGARAGTREHMLGDLQLDAAQYPKVSLKCQRVTASPDRITVELSVTLRDHTSHLSVPVSWQRTGSTLQANGEFTFTQTSLGLEAYSLLFGALRVSDEIRVRFRLVARTS